MGVETPLTQEITNSGASNPHPSAKNNPQLSKDVEHADSFDPFAERAVPNPTSDRDTLMHLLKASLGSGILSMPTAFRCVGLFMGVLLTILVSTICTYCAYILVKCAHVLYYRKRKTQLTFADVAEISLADGPAPLRKFAKTIRWVVEIGLFLAYFTTCSAYAVVIADNILGILGYFTSGQIHSDNHKRIILAALMIFFIVLSWIKDLKVLTPFSTMANCFMGVSLALIFGYLGWSISNNENSFLQLRENFFKRNETDGKVWSLSTANGAWYGDYPVFFSLTIFAIEAIGVIMPLENKMETPKNFLGLFGVLSKGMAAVTVVYIFLGTLGYWNNPLAEASIITGEITLAANLDSTKDKIVTTIGLIVRIAVALAVLFTFTLQFFVCLDIFWNWIKNKVSQKSESPGRTVRSSITIVAVLIAIAVPDVTPLIGLIGAFCFSILGLLLPVVIESAVYWKNDQHRTFRTVKNVLIGLFAMLALVFGTMVACGQVYERMIRPYLK